MNTKAQLLTMMHSVDKFDAIVYAATAGDVSTVQRILEQHPEEVCLFRVFLYPNYMYMFDTCHTIALKMCQSWIYIVCIL